MDEKRTSTERPAAPDIAATSGAASIRTASCPFGRFGVRSFILPCRDLPFPLGKGVPHSNGPRSLQHVVEACMCPGNVPGCWLVIVFRQHDCRLL